MSLNPQYIPLYQLQSYFVDKATGAPLAGGKVYFYSDVNRTVPKTVYELSSTTGTYTYVPLPNPIILSSVGTPVDNNGNDIVIYAYPYDAFGNSELYYVVVQDADGRPQFTREAVPGISGSGSPSGNSGLFNYVPNGQFLVHTDLPSSTDTLVAGTNVIAQGGFTVELSNPLGSVNKLQFIPQGFTEDPENSPRYLARFTAVTFDPADTIKSIRIKWNDVNKFSANDNFYTFAFWGESNVNIPVSINIIKYFGTTGTVVPAETIFTDTITPTGDIHQYQFQFGQNFGDVVDTVNNNDFVAIDIALPTNIGFVLDVTNFTLVLGQQVLTAFPLQTNADMITRGNDGWTDLPNPNGYDLLLPKVQTRIGYEYAEWEVGDIGATAGNIISPLSTSPLPRGNRMLLDGATYIYADYSTLGIPFSRLGDFLVDNSTIPECPMFGTGANYATAYGNLANMDILRLSVNSSGVGVAYAQDGTGARATGFTFTGIPIYNGSTVGHVSLNYNAYSSGVAINQLICRANFKTFDFADDPLTYCIDGDVPTGFTFTPFNYDTGLYAQQGIAFSIDTLAGATLITGGPGKTFYFFTANNHTLPYYIWFDTGTETDPGPPLAQPGALPIQVNVNTTDNAEDIANTLQEVMNAYQITNIDFTVIPPAGSYFTFQTNPGAVRTFYVWYTFNGAGSDPLILGAIGINVNVLSSYNMEDVRHYTLFKINQYQYAVPDAQGMFLRNYDPTGLWDFDNLTRWSTVTGLTGPNLGTFEYSQLLSHYHEVFAVVAPAINNLALGPDTLVANTATGNTGGSETRPVNMYVNYYIKY
jgi:hypothetical protein